MDAAGHQVHHCLYFQPVCLMAVPSPSLKDLYIDRPLPYLIGSKLFMEQEDVGLGELSSEGALSHQCFCHVFQPNLLW